MALPLENQVAFITGAGSGLGAAAARRLAKDGAIVAINDMNETAAQAIASELGGIALPFDVADSYAFDASVESCVSQLGRLDIMVNNAGIAPSDVSSKTERMVTNQVARMEGRIGDIESMDYLLDLTDDAWNRMVQVHLYGTFYGCRAALRHMQPQRSGRIINISSILGLKPAAGAPH
jgi:3-oxoacyl-[acyl-carrier protein] reductase